MEDEAPAPWEELFQVLRLSRNPQAAALCWIQEAKFSSLFPKPPCFAELLTYLGALVPQVDGATNRLNLVPRIICFNQELQRNLLCILARHTAEIPTELLKDISTKCEQCYLSVGNKTLLYYLSLIDGSSCGYAYNSMRPAVENLAGALVENANISTPVTETSRPKFLSKLTEKFLNNSSLGDNSTECEATQASNTSKKRSLDDGEQTVAKKARMSVLPEEAGTSNSSNAQTSTEEIESSKREAADESAANVEKLRSIIVSKDIKAFCEVLKPENSFTIRQLCSSVYPDGVPFDWLSNLGEHLLEENNLESMEIYIHALCLPTTQALKAIAPRKFIQLVQRIARPFGDLIVGQLLVPLVSNGDVDKNRSAFILNVIRGHLDGSHVCTLLKSALENKPCAQANFEGLVSLQQSLLNVKFTPDEELINKFCNFISFYATRHQKSFPFIKTVLAFLKKCGKILEQSHLEMIRDPLENNKTTLKDACLALIDSV